LSTLEHAAEILYETPRGKWIDWRNWEYDRAMAFLERDRNYSDLQLVLLDIDSRKMKIIPLNEEVFKEYSNWMIFGADEVEGRRFWLMYLQSMLGEKRIYQLWEDGSIDSIGASQKWPHYINKILFSYAANETKLYDVNRGTLKLLKIFKDVDPRFGLYGLDISRNGILVKKGKRIKVYTLPDLKEVKFKKL
jgi:hypothetical protein